MPEVLQRRYGHAGRPSLSRAKSAARGAFDLDKFRGATDRAAHGRAQEAAAKVLGTFDGTHELAEYAEAYHRARTVEGLSSATAERAALAVYEAALRG
jgi:hypothetical protein